jgi:hypothetical protein
MHGELGGVVPALLPGRRAPPVVAHYLGAHAGWYTYHGPGNVSEMDGSSHKAGFPAALGTEVTISAKAWKSFCKKQGGGARENPGPQRILAVSKGGEYRLRHPVWWWREEDLEAL